MPHPYRISDRAAGRIIVSAAFIAAAFLMLAGMTWGEEWACANPEGCEASIPGPDGDPVVTAWREGDILDSDRGWVLHGSDWVVMHSEQPALPGIVGMLDEPSQQTLCGIQLMSDLIQCQVEWEDCLDEHMGDPSGCVVFDSICKQNARAAFQDCLNQ